MRVTCGAPGHIMPPAARAVELARRAEADGFETVWWPCHLMGWHPDSVWTEDLTPLAAVQPSPHVYLEPLSMMAAVGAATERIRVGVCVTDVIRRHPAMLAQTMLTVDHLAGGRAILGLGSGESMNVTPYGLRWSRPYSRLNEAIEVMRLLWSADGPVSFDGRFFRLEHAVLGLEPYEGRHPEVWIAAHAPRMLGLVGRQGDGWLPTQMDPESYAEKLGIIRESAERAGRDPDAITPSMLAYVLCAPDEETLDRMCENPLVRLLFPAVSVPQEVYAALGTTPPFEGDAGYESYLPTTVTREEAMRVVEHIPPAIVRRTTLHGDAAQIVSQVRAFQDAGLRDIVLWNITAFADASLAGYSFRVLREVRELLST
jgi:phthiodiolone/phenolphthiodiolone dimycocerosates ketoreductase